MPEQRYDAGPLEKLQGNPLMKLLRGVSFPQAAGLEAVGQGVEGLKGLLQGEGQGALTGAAGASIPSGGPPVEPFGLPPAPFMAPDQKGAALSSMAHGPTGPLPSPPPTQQGPAMPEIDLTSKPSPLESLEEGTEVEDEFALLDEQAPLESMQTPAEQDDVALQGMERINPVDEAPATESAGVDPLKNMGMWKGRDLFDVLQFEPELIQREDPELMLNLLQRLKQQGMDALIEEIKKKIQGAGPEKTLEFPKGAPGAAGSRPGEFTE